MSRFAAPGPATPARPDDATGRARRTWDVEAVLTDLDGVLAGSIAAVEQAWRQWSDEVGLDPEVVLHDLHGRRASDSIRRLAPDRDLDAELHRLEAYELGLVDTTEPIPGAARLIGALPPERWAVVTSGTRRLAGARLAAVGHPAPRVLVGAEDVLAGKPDPEGYRAAALALGVAPERCLVIEDAPAGIQAGRVAGCTVVAVATSHAPADLGHADLVVTDPGHLEVRVGAAGLRVTAAPHRGGSRVGAAGRASRARRR